MLALTGASGFLGGRIAALAAENGWRVRALMRRPPLAPIPGVSEIIAGDLANGEALTRLVDGVDAIVHNAGVVRARRATDFFAANTAGAAAMARAAAAAKTATDTTAPFLLVSSLAARRPWISAYAASKAGAEASVRRILPGRALAILRPPAVYGPADAATRPLFTAIARGFTPMPGPVSARFSMIYVDDAARAALAALEGLNPADSPDGACLYEVDDGGKGYRWGDVHAAAEGAIGCRLRSLHIPTCLLWGAGFAADAIASAGLATPFLSRDKIYEMCAGDWISNPTMAPPKWSPEVSLQAGFRKTLTWYREGR